MTGAAWLEPLLSQALLVLAVLFARPVRGWAWAGRLVLQAGLLCACLAVALLVPRPGADRVRLGFALLAALLQLGVLGVLRRRGLPSEPAAAARLDGVPWLLPAAALAVLSIGMVSPVARDVAGIGLGLLLTGLLAMVAGGTRRTERLGGLLLAGDGVLFAAGLLPGLPPEALLAAVLLQAASLAPLVVPRPDARQAG